MLHPKGGDWGGGASNMSFFFNLCIWLHEVSCGGQLLWHVGPFAVEHGLSGCSS